jgi:TolB protein
MMPFLFLMTRRLAAAIIGLAAIMLVLVLVGRRADSGMQLTYASNRDGNWNIYLNELSRMMEVKLTHTRGSDYDPAWSPDGKRLAFVSSTYGAFSVFVLDIAAHSLRSVTHTTLPFTRPSWLDNQRLVLRTPDEPRQPATEYVLDLVTGAHETRTAAAQSLLEPVVSPNGERTAAVHVNLPSSQLTITDQSTATTIAIAHTGARNLYPSWSHDSLWLAYASNRDHNWEIYAVDASGRIYQRVTFALSEEKSPIWRPTPAQYETQIPVDMG